MSEEDGVLELRQLPTSVLAVDHWSYINEGGQNVVCAAKESLADAAMVSI